MLPLERVPNFSEGRDRRRSTRSARRSAGTPRLLDVHADEDHNRSVFTLVGSEDELVDASLEGIAWRSSGSTCDANRAPIRGSGRRMSCRSCRSGPTRWNGRARAAALVGARIGAELGLPVFVYEPPERGPAFYRRGGLDELQRRLDDGELRPDYGPRGCTSRPAA